MKIKLLTTASVIAVLASSAAYAATEGNYAGLNLIQSQFTTQQTQPTKGAKAYDKNNNGFGLSYKYAFNMDGMFVAPGVYFNEYHGNKNEGVRYGYGVRADFGYDINDKVAPYIVLGFGRLNVKSLALSGNTATKAKAFNKNTFMYGIGVKLAAADNIDVSFEVNRQSFDLTNKKASTSKFKDKLQVVQLGVSYKF